MFEYLTNFKLELNTAWPNFIVKGEPRATENRYGQISRVTLPITHSELGLFKEISGNDIYTLQEKLNQLLVGWDKKYQTHLDRISVEDGRQSAEELIESTQAQIYELSQILGDTLAYDDTVDWESLKSTAGFQKLAFEEPKPTMPKLPDKPVHDLPAFAPEVFDYPKYVAPKVPFLMRTIGRKTAILENAKKEWDSSKEVAEIRHNQAQKKKKDEYEVEVAELEEAHKVALQRHQQDCERISAAYIRREQAWEKKNEQWNAEQNRLEKGEIDRIETHNLGIDALKENWQAGAPEAVVEHACMVLDKSTYPDWFQGSYRFSFDHTNRLGQIEFLLPGPRIVDLPKSARFVASTGEIKTTSLSKSDQKKLYDDLCYQVALRTVHELYEADTVENFDAILFNGVVDQVNPATGIDERLTIMSGMFERSKFLEINLEKVDPKACFKSFKGVSASSLIGLAAVAPIMEISKDDERFIEDRSIAATFSPEINLAAMDWEDFEHLVREIFAKEFSDRGGEVKVTQSSSDGGVDAIAFDPDPISGGKIVIQAKRYTRTVGVAAVRDLYGTVMNEGASKGLLVTTADYGPDAYKFVADKPLTLLNGSNLLFLLDKHGIKATIDIPTARKELGLGRSAAH